MTSGRLSALLLALLSAAAAAADHGAADDAAPPSARAAFERLSSLVGRWRGGDGRGQTVTYRLTAGGSVLVETWALAPGRESMTLYHLDGDALLATHYCPQGNQPTLRYAPTASDARRLSFAFERGSNLGIAGRWHQHSMWIEFGSGGFTRAETYIENGTDAPAVDAEPEQPVMFERIGDEP
jgi:hypothetical protein